MRDPGRDADMDADPEPVSFPEHGSGPGSGPYWKGTDPGGLVPGLGTDPEPGV